MMTRRDETRCMLCITPTYGHGQPHLTGISHDLARIARGKDLVRRLVWFPIALTQPLACPFELYLVNLNRTSQTFRLHPGSSSKDLTQPQLL